MLFVSLFLFTTLTFSQNVGIKADGTAPDNSAMLEVGSTEKGFLMPRMTTDEIAAITSPANGLMVYCTTDGKFYIYNSLIVAWKEIKYGSGIIATNCGKINDLRDGKIYNTVIIGTQCWMAQNLTCQPSVSGAGRPSSITSCPTGWHFPTDAEQTTLITYLGSNSGFTALPAGFCTENGQTIKPDGFSVRCLRDN